MINELDGISGKFRRERQKAKSEVKMTDKDLCRTPVDGMPRATLEVDWLHGNNIFCNLKVN